MKNNSGSENSGPNDANNHKVFRGGNSEEVLSVLPHRYSQVLEKWASKTPDSAALISLGRTITYGELWQHICEATDRLQKAGVRAGDRVAIVAENGPQGITQMFAVSELDAWSVPINARSTQREVETITDFAECRISVFCLADSEVTKDHAKTAGATVEEDGFGPLAFSDFNEEVEPEPVYHDKARDTAVLVFTSGTTGAPKSVMLSHQGLMYMGSNMAALRNFTSDDCLYNSSPVSHVIGLGTVLLTAFSAGGSVEIASSFSAEDVVRSITSGRITCITGVPTLFGRIIDYSEKAGISLRENRMRILGTAGAPLTLALKTRIEEAFGLGLYNSYALSECNPIARSRTPVMDNDVGELQPGVELLLLGENGQDVPVGEAGEIWVKSPGQMLGYYKNAAATKAAKNEAGFIATGDLGEIDDKGLLRIVGRLKDIVIRSGFNVYPAEVEGVIEKFPGVGLVAVLGHAKEDNEEVVAFIQPAVGSSLKVDDVMQFCKKNLAPYKRPSRIIISEALPLSETGKVQKKLLSVEFDQ